MRRRLAQAVIVALISGIFLILLWAIALSLSPKSCTYGPPCTAAEAPCVTSSACLPVAPVWAFPLCLVATAAVGFLVWRLVDRIPQRQAA